MSENFIIYETHNGFVPVTDEKQIKILELLAEKSLSFNNISSSPGISFNPAYSISKLQKSGIINKNDSNDYQIIGKIILNSKSANKCDDYEYNTLTEINRNMLSYIFLDFCDAYGFHKNTFLDSYARILAEITKNKLTGNSVESVVELFNSMCKPFKVRIKSHEPLSIDVEKCYKNDESSMVSINVLKHWMEHIHGTKYEIANRVNCSNNLISITFESHDKPHNTTPIENKKADCPFAITITDSECRIISHPVQVKIVDRIVEKLATRNTIIDEIDACYTTINTNLKKMSDSGLIFSIDAGGLSYCFPVHNTMIFAGGGGVEHLNDTLKHNESDNILNGFFDFMCQKLKNEKQLTIILGSFIFSRICKKCDDCQKELYKFAERLNLELKLEKSLPLTYHIKHPVNGFDPMKDNLMIGAIRNHVASSVGHNMDLKYRTDNKTESKVEISIIST